MQFGKYDCSSVELNRFLLDGGAMFGAVPKPLWEKKIRPDAANRIPMTARSLVIRGNGRTILVDAGIGDKLSGKLRRIYDVADTGTLSDRISACGVLPGDITDVVLTHLHFDHTGGATAYDENGNAVPAFDNAVYHIQKDQWELALAPSVRDRGSYMKENFLPLRAHGRLNLVDGPIEDFFDGIDLLVSHGHTRGQQHLLVKDRQGGLFFASDMIPTAAHLPIAWNMAYDNEPLVLLEEKERLLSRAAAERWFICFPHDPETAAARVNTENDKVVKGEVVEL